MGWWLSDAKSLWANHMEVCRRIMVWLTFAKSLESSAALLQSCCFFLPDPSPAKSDSQDLPQGSASRISNDVVREHSDILQGSYSCLHQGC